MVSPSRTNHQIYTVDDPLVAAAAAIKIATLRAIDTYAHGRDSRVLRVTVRLTSEWSALAMSRGLEPGQASVGHDGKSAPVR